MVTIENESGAQKSLLDRIIKKLSVKLESEETKGSITDLIRLLQLRREISDEQPKEVEVRWVESSTENDVSSK